MVKRKLGKRLQDTETGQDAPRKKRRQVKKSRFAERPLLERELLSDLRLLLLVELTNHIDRIPWKLRSRFNAAANFSGCVLKILPRPKGEASIDVPTFVAVVGDQECSVESLVREANMLLKGGTKAVIAIHVNGKKLRARPFGATKWAQGEPWQVITKDVPHMKVPLQAIYPAASTNIVLEIDLTDLLVD